MNNSKVLEISERIKEHLNILQRYTEIPADEILNNTEKIWSMRYGFEMIVEDCINIGNHIIAENNFRAPQNYKDVFQVLFENNIISQELAEKLKRAAGIRNIIVHLYWKIDDLKIIQFIKNNLDIFNEFIKSILKNEL